MQWFILARWLYTRSWLANERPIVLFDLATHRLVEDRVLLPGVSVLEAILVPEGSRRISKLDRLRRSPTDISRTGLVKALERTADPRELGVGDWDLTEVHWLDMLRVAGSLVTGQVRAYDPLRMSPRCVQLAAASPYAARHCFGRCLSVHSGGQRRGDYQLLATLNV